jgi:hypothetical protein
MPDLFGFPLGSQRLSDCGGVVIRSRPDTGDHLSFVPVRACPKLFNLLLGNPGAGQNLQQWLELLEQLPGVGCGAIRERDEVSAGSNRQIFGNVEQ